MPAVLLPVSLRAFSSGFRLGEISGPHVKVSAPALYSGNRTRDLVRGQCAGLGRLYLQEFVGSAT